MKEPAEQKIITEAPSFRTDVKSEKEVVVETPVTTEVVTEAKHELSKIKVEEKSDLTWNDFLEEEETVETTTEKTTTDADEKATLATEEKVSQVQKEEVVKEYWQIAAEKAGIEAKDEIDFISQVKKTEYIRTNDDQLHQLQQIAKLSPEERVAAKLSQVDGVPDNLIQKQIKYLKDNEIFDIELSKVDNLVRTKIQQRTTAIKAEQNKLQAEQNEFLKNIETEVSKTETLFGMKVGKDADSISAWQKRTIKDIRNGELGKLVNDRLTSKDVNKLLELYQFLKHQEKVTIGFKNAGASQASKQLLDEIENAKSEQNGKTFETVKDNLPDKDTVPSWRTKK